MQRALDHAFSSKPNVKGILISDGNGLCIAAKGDQEVSPDKSGRYSSIAKLAADLSSDPNETSPSILIETDDRNLLVKEYDAMVIVLSCTKSEN